MTIELHDPLKISARLLPAVNVGADWLSIEPTGEHDGRGAPEWRFYLDLRDGTEHTDAGLNCWADDPHEIMSTLLCFMTACAESRRYGRDGENADLFTEPVAAWCEENADELGMLEYELSERAES